MQIRIFLNILIPSVFLQNIICLSYTMKTIYDRGKLYLF